MPIFSDSDKLIHLLNEDLDDSGRIVSSTIPVFIMIQGDFCGHCRRAKPAFASAVALAGLSNKLEGKDLEMANRARARGASAVNYCTAQVDTKDPSEKQLVERLKKVLKSHNIEVGGVPQFVLYYIDANGAPVYIQYPGGRETLDFLHFTSPRLF